MKFFRPDLSLLFENQAPISPVKQLDEIEALGSAIKDNISQEIRIPKDVLDSFKIKDTLNQDIWPDGKLSPKIQSKLIKIAKGFLSDIKLKNAQIKDVLFTGSLANYNWSKFSDIDLHIVLDLTQFDSDTQMVKDFFKAQKTLWNQEHDITVFDYPVEVYVQDSKEKLVATAVYSVLKDKWLKKPIREEFKVDKNAIKDKAENFIEQLKDIRKDYDSEDYQDVTDKATTLKDKIKQLRKAGLEKGGEFSQENLVFKVLRRTSFMELLDSYKAKAYDSLMSVTELTSINENETDMKGGVLFILGAELPDGTQRLYATTIKNVLYLNRKKTNNEPAATNKMAVFGNNEVGRVGLADDKLKAFRVAWGDNRTKLKKLGVTKTSVSINENKTPFHWLSVKYNNIPQAVNALSGKLQGIPNIKWIG